MAGVSLKCGDCGALLRTVEEAQEHAELTSHSNFSECTEPVLNLVCTACSKPCRSKTESDLHTKRTGHTEFVDRTSEAVKPISLEAPKVDATYSSENPSAAASTDQNEEMVVPEVDKKLLEELETMGFSTARATRALHYSGNAGLEAAVSWIVEHENDPDIDQMPLVPANTKIEAAKPSLTPEELKAKQQELRERARKKKEEEEKRTEREREKERIRIGKELLEAKRIEEENERKRVLALRKAEKEEERRAREKIKQKLEEDKAERRRRLGLPPEEPSAAKPSPVVEEKKSFVPVRPATKAEQMRECLRSLKQNHKEDDARVKRAFQTLLTYVGNVARNPNEEKFRKIRLTNQSFQERVGSLKGGIEFLEICGFEKIDGGEFLFLPRDKVEMAVLNSAGSELDSAIKNPFFGVL
ncbi:UBX domain-containing protein 1 [Cajanus cajan]|uniref:UBX domain-containing protein 1 n=1 Tax=Cajanus cajan TaxID=3821 RepID=A0A151QZH5_CAJCA|nr:UBX domain-containing protein 1 [Cajanus cajan]KYP35652.1 UBX domain-containing protein 1 [Cajanus cajan]